MVMAKRKSFELYENTIIGFTSSMRKRKQPSDLYAPTLLAQFLVTISTIPSKEIPSTMSLYHSSRQSLRPTTLGMLT